MSMAIRDEKKYVSMSTLNETIKMHIKKKEVRECIFIILWIDRGKSYDFICSRCRS
jgi:hypothetical protein